MRIAGLTGGIASGKSAVTTLLRQKGVEVVDADEIAHAVLRKVIDMPLLFETGTNRLTNPNMLVTCGPEAQVQRLMLRDRSSREDALARIASQMPEDVKRRRAQIIIDNSGTATDLVGQVDHVVTQLRRGAVWRGALLSPVAAASLFGLMVFAIVR